MKTDYQEWLDAGSPDTEVTVYVSGVIPKGKKLSIRALEKIIRAWGRERNLIMNEYYINHKTGGVIVGYFFAPLIDFRLPFDHQDRFTLV